MSHPLTGKALYFYTAVWVLIIATHAVVLGWAYDMPWSMAVTDSLAFNMLLMGFGFGYWFVVKYLNNADQGLTVSIINQVLSVIIGVALLTYVSGTVLDKVFAHENYSGFLKQTLPWRLFIGSMYMGLVVLVYHLIRHNYNLRQKEYEEVQLQHLLRQSELEMLKFQLNPHFIFNSLNSISSLTITAPEQAREMVIKLSDFLRNSLGKEESELQAVEQELKQMQVYLDIEKVRFGDRLLIDQEIQPECLQMTLPAMILQPLYENAIKYGVYEQLESVTIYTRCSCEDGYLKLSVSNNYDCHAKPKKGKGIGLKNVRSRLELTYGIPDLVTIEKERNKFTVHLLIPQHDQSHNN